MADLKIENDSAPNDLEEDDDEEENEVETKISLAQAYLELGDMDGAKGLLTQALPKGDNAQKQIIEKMLASMPSSK